MAEAPTATLVSALAAGTARLAAAGLPEPRREVLRLWASVAGEAAELQLLRGPEAAPDPDRADAFARAVERRASGEPLAHVTGRSGFRHLELRSDGRALIPRPETEGLVELLLSRASGGRVADVGTGTGCIALSLAAEGQYHEVVAVDRSAEALALAHENVADARAAVLLVRGDLSSALADGCCDALVSNPPYLSEAEYLALDPAVRDWEPASALVSGEDGLLATGVLLEDALRVVRPGGWIALETDCSRAAEAARRASALGWRDVAVHIDLFGRERYLLARRSEG